MVTVAVMFLWWNKDTKTAIIMNEIGVRAPEWKYRNEDSLKEAAKVMNKFSNLSLGHDGYTQLSDKHTHPYFTAGTPDNSMGTFPVVMAAAHDLSTSISLCLVLIIRLEME